MEEKNTQSRKFWSGLVTGLLLAILIMGTAFLVKQLSVIRAMKQSGKDVSEADQLVNSFTTTKMGVLEDTIRQYYLEEVDQATLENGVYEGIVDSLKDPYSVYYSTEALEEINQKTEGIYYGIGAYITRDPQSDYCMISGVIANTPAQEAGLQQDDVIYKIDGEDVIGLETSELVTKIKGEEGTIVHMTIVRRATNETLEFDVERRKIESPTVESSMEEDGIGYIQITEFDDVTEDQFAEALAVCKESGMKGLILDLRSNPGGNLNTVCEICRMLLPKGLIVYTEDKYGKRDEYSCEGDRQLEVPLVVLVNGYSASASEILAGAVKDYGIGTIMGTTTFGKGIVQRIISLSDGSAVKLTVSKYYTPKGNNIHGIGIEPDIMVEFDAEKYNEEDFDNQLEAAKEELRKQMGN
ncbi:MAG: S41 family peptidase [Lachnospiraceae bacterium]|nr:S41 family peptidase [Lachnospiraceae bacterium]